jgi:predicted P-loop ATPase
MTGPTLVFDHQRAWLKHLEAAEGEDGKLAVLRQAPRKLSEKGDSIDDLRHVAIHALNLDETKVFDAIAGGENDFLDDRAQRISGRRPQRRNQLPSWAGEGQLNDKSNLIPNLRNTLLAVRNAPEIKDCFRLDEMSRKTMMVKAIGGSPIIPKPADDIDVAAIQEWMQKQGMFHLGRDTTFQAIQSRASECRYHPVKDYLEGLKWDGKQRLEQWLTICMGAEQSPYTQKIGRYFLISMVARILKPGCKADYMLIFEGPQGTGKSTSCRILAGEDYFTDSLGELGNKDASLNLRGKWLVEVAEMHAFGRAEAAELKSFITRTEERYRPPFGRMEVIEPRQCIFIGTTNKSSYLRDETGGRRFWPVKTGKIDRALLAERRDQLFAEAVDCFKRGHAWWPDSDFETTFIAPQQEARFEEDVWEEKISDWIADKSRVLVGQIAIDALGFPVARIGTADQRRIAAVLKRINWQREKGEDGKDKVDGHGKRWWVRC